MTATFTQISADLELLARWLRSDDALTALLHVPAPPTAGGGGTSRSGEISRPTEAAALRGELDPNEREKRRALSLIASAHRSGLEVIEILVALGAVARSDAGDRCRAEGCSKPANARRGLCWSHYDRERGR